MCIHIYTYIYIYIYASLSLSIYIYICLRKGWRSGHSGPGTAGAALGAATPKVIAMINNHQNNSNNIKQNSNHIKIYQWPRRWGPRCLGDSQKSY